MRSRLAPNYIKLFFLVLLFSFTQTALANDWGGKDRFTISDAASVDEAVGVVTSTLERQGYDIVAVINHSDAAASVGLSLPDTQVVLFRHPRTDLKLIKRSQTTAIDLPLKMLVWDDNGVIKHKYNGPGYLADRHHIILRDNKLSSIAWTLDQFGPQANGLVSVQGTLSVADTTAALTTILTDAGFRIPITIDYAADQGPRIRDTTLIIFGNPAIGTQLMQNAREVALDLPQKFLVWADRKGQTWITYNDPAYIAQRAGVQGLDTLLGNIAAALANFANQGANGN